MKDEPTFKDFQVSEDVLDEFLIDMTLEGGRTFRTYEKLSSLEETAIEYFSELHQQVDGFLMSEGDVIIDVGAHHGIVSIYAAINGAAVEAYEPNPLNFSVLSKNVEINPDLNISIFNYAVMGVAGDLLFNFGKTSTTGAMVSVGRDWKRTEDSILVKGIGVHEILSNHKKIKLLKLDCEGAEYDIFRDMSEADFSKVEVFYVEVHPTEKYGITEFEEIMKKKKCPYFKKEVAHGCFEFVCSRMIKC